MRLTRKTYSITLALALVVSGSAHAQGWIKFVSDQDDFLVNFPGEPTVSEIDYVTESNSGHRGPRHCTHAPARPHSIR